MQRTECTRCRECTECTQYECSISPSLFLSNLISKLIEGSLEVKLPTIWTDGEAEVGRVREEKKRSEVRSQLAR